MPQNGDNLGKFKVSAHDGDIGHVEDFLLEDATWLIPYLAVDSPLRPGSILADIDCVGRLDWVAREVYVLLPVATLVAGPAYTSSQRLTPELDRVLHDYDERIGTTR